VIEAGLTGLREFTERFVNTMNLHDMVIMGNSLGGHIAILYTLANPDKVAKLVLTGSSGLFENTMGGSYPRRGSYDYIRERVAYTFYDPQVASTELVDEVFETTRSIPKCMRIVCHLQRRYHVINQLLGYHAVIRFYLPKNPLRSY